MTLLDEVCELADRRPDATEGQQLILKMTICPLDQLDNPNRTRAPRVTFTADELRRLPGRWELLAGQLTSY